MRRMLEIVLAALVWLPSLSYASGKVPAEAEVTARKGPIQITLRIYKKVFESGDDPWYQIELKNIGRKKIYVTDDGFFTDSGIPESANTYPRKYPTRCYGLCLEVIDSKGQYPWPMYSGEAEPTSEKDWKPIPEERLKKITPRIKELRKQGLTDGQISLQITKEFPVPKEPKPYIWLAPGASTTTIASAACHKLAECHNGEHMPQPIGDFAELAYIMWEPGKYRIRAIYNHETYDSDIKKFHLKRQEQDVLVKTPWIEIEMLPPRRAPK